MELSENILYYFLVSSLSCVVFSFLFLYALSSKLIQKIVGDASFLIYTAITILAASLTIIFGLQTFILVFFDRELAGRLLFLSTIFGTVFVTLGIIKVIEKKTIPIEEETEYEKRKRALSEIKSLTNFGLYLGNIIVFFGNFLCFFFKIKSFL